MDPQKVDMFIMANAKFFASDDVNRIRDKMMTLDDSRWAMISTTQFKDPTTILIVSILAGTLGLDRFMIGDIGLGVGKLLTCGGFGLWAIIDWFIIQDATRERNITKIHPFLT